MSRIRVPCLNYAAREYFPKNETEVPFRIGHHFASKLTDYGRGKDLKLQEIPFAEVQRIYAENANTALPMQEHEYREIISAEYMVFGRKGLGGPQVKEVQRCIEKALTTLRIDRDRIELNCKDTAEADRTRREGFVSL